MIDLMFHEKLTHLIAININYLVMVGLTNITNVGTTGNLNDVTANIVLKRDSKTTTSCLRALTKMIKYMKPIRYLTKTVTVNPETMNRQNEREYKHRRPNMVSHTGVLQRDCHAQLRQPTTYEF